MKQLFLIMLSTLAPVFSLVLKFNPTKKTERNYVIKNNLASRFKSTFQATRVQPFMVMDWSATKVRNTFIDFYVKKKEHSYVVSSPVVPLSDPTLLFANAGMNQFKPIFLGQLDPNSPFASLKRVVNSQKCIRAGGKHNDLEDVGKDTYHHTFFEMLGTWSFNGEYFKEESINWGWEILTKEYGLDPNRMYATYFEGDINEGLEPDYEARDFWLKLLPSERVLASGKKDNFWEMGDIGPCGPCSEIHYDRIGGRNAALLVNKDDPNVIEIWNHVFIQFNREADGTLKQLPNKHVDTGMGFERLVSILQDKSSNYDSDVFGPLFDNIQKVTGAPAYSRKLGEEDVDLKDTAYRIIADHARTLTFAISDGAVPSNEGRGYVLRRILRRAVRYGQQILGAEKGFFQKLVPTVIDSFEMIFPDLKNKQSFVQQIIKNEEDSFSLLLERGVKFFKEMQQEMGKTGTQIITGQQAFYLYDTLGFPLDLTQLMASEVGLVVDVLGFEKEMAAQKKRSRDAGKKKMLGDQGQIVLGAEQTAKLAQLGVSVTDDRMKYSMDIQPNATIRALFGINGFVENSWDSNAEAVGILLDSTSFYAEAGGQVADSGEIIVSNVAGGAPAVFDVQDVQSFAGYVLHIGFLKTGVLRTGDSVTLSVDYQRRRKIAPNHTMTHVMNFGLLKVLGPEVHQKGSLVNDEKLRFDFSHNKPMDPTEILKVEEIVSSFIDEKKVVYSQVVPLKKAQAINGLRAVFGEVYPDPVRVISVGSNVGNMIADPTNQCWEANSVEFCGGTHIQNSEEAGAFVIIEETAVAKGIRRLTGITGELAQSAKALGAQFQNDIDLLEKSTKPPEEIEKMIVSARLELDEATISASLKPVLRNKLEYLGKELMKKKKASSQASLDRALNKLENTLTGEQFKSNKAIVLEVEIGADTKAVKNVVGLVQKLKPEAPFMGFSCDFDSRKLLCFAIVPESAIKKGLKAGEWVATGLEVCGGRGGGRPNMAQGQAPDFDKKDDAIQSKELCFAV